MPPMSVVPESSTIDRDFDRRAPPDRRGGERRERRLALAKPLVDAIRSVSDLPIHFHTHNTTSAMLATLMMMSQAGCDIVDCALASMADGTSQPSLNAFVASQCSIECH